MRPPSCVPASTFMRPMEGVRDGLAVQEPKRRPELAAFVGEQCRPLRGTAVVEGGQPPTEGTFASAECVI